MTPIFAAAISWGAATRTPRLGYARRVAARIALVVVLVVALAAPAAAAKPRLKAFDSCAGLVRYAQRNADHLPLPTERTPTPVAAPEAGEDHSTTNVQEGGVDEPDTVKTDGRRLFVVAGGSLHVIDARARPPRLLDSLALPQGMQHELLLRGDRVLVLTQLGGFGIDEPRLIQPGVVSRAGTMLSEIAVSGGRLRLVRTLETEGSYVSARLTGATARVVISTTPRALETGAGSDLPAWMPRATLTRPTAASAASAGSSAAAPSATRPPSRGSRWSRCSRSTWRRASRPSTPTR